MLAVVGDIACQPGTEAAGEASNEICSDPASPYTATSLWQSQVATANQIENMQPDLVALLGDLQYQVGRYSDFEQSFDWTYGYFKSLHRPAPGNHEFYDEHGETGVGGYGYFAYYNGFQIDPTSGLGYASDGYDLGPVSRTQLQLQGGQDPRCGPLPPTHSEGVWTGGVLRADGRTRNRDILQRPLGGTAAPTGVGDGWYSYNVGSWHLISLNIECYTQPGGCSTTGSWFAAELAWLKNDLAANHSFCTAAYWHQPMFSPTNGITNEGITSQAFWQLLYEYGADLVLNGHDHLYAHYRPLNPSGNYDPNKGIREFVVGTGGETLDPVVTATVTPQDAANETNMEDPFGNPNFNALESRGGNRGLLGCDGPDAQSGRLHVGFRVRTGRSYSCSQWSYISCTDCEWWL